MTRLAIKQSDMEAVGKVVDSLPVSDGVTEVVTTVEDGCLGITVEFEEQLSTAAMDQLYADEPYWKSGPEHALSIDPSVNIPNDDVPYGFITVYFDIRSWRQEQ